MTIQQYRKSLELTQDQFANKFQIPFATLQAWESGAEKTPPYVLNMVKRLAELGKTKPGYNPMYDSDYLISRDGEKNRRYLVELHEDELIDIRSEINTILKRHRGM